jgi:hypothetical protein
VESIIWQHVVASFIMGSMFGLLLDDLLQWIVRARNARNRE